MVRKGLLLSIVVCITGTVSCCRFPPSVWCSSPEIARDCRVTKQCAAYHNERYGASDPVNFTLYYESLCPDCKQFMKGQLFLAYNKIGSIMNLGLVPYGNAQERKVGRKWEFDCQHGKEECVGNLIETCSMFVLRNISIYFPFIHCMESSAKMPKEAAKDCARSLQINLSPIMKCSEDQVGNQLEHQMALKTDALIPKHQYVPWVTLNGVHTEQIETAAETDLIKLICDTYKGPKPPGCTEQKKRRNCLRY